MPILTLIRGLPGSGKSTLARSMGIDHFEADMWMNDGDGVYRFDPRKLSWCHTKCIASAKMSLSKGRDVVVSNTFTQRWEMQPYIDLGYPVVEIVARGDFGNVHGVPSDKVEQMRARWER